MVKIYRQMSIAISFGLSGAFLSGALAAPQIDTPPPSLEQMKAVESVRSRGDDSDSKLDGELTILSRQFVVSRSATKDEEPVNSSAARTFGVKKGDKDPTVEVAITGDVLQSDLEKLGAKIRFKSEGVTYACVRVKTLGEIAKLKGVELVQGMHSLEIPKPPTMKSSSEAVPRGMEERLGSLADSFDHQKLTGKGVVVGVVDSGIDWRHPDFISPDGTSRIQYLWDMNDDSFETSGGEIGNRAPQSSPDGKSIGTVYTREQITSALKGQGTVNSFDRMGHGTACAGVAAGNGEATANGVPKGSYPGVASEADLMIVCAPYRDESGEDVAIRPDAYLGVEWIVSQSKKLKRPCSINLSYGGHTGSHDGTSSEERFLNKLAGADKPGVAICVAGGNERSSSLHASGRFGPDKEGSQKSSKFIELNTYNNRMFNASAAFCFDPKDDWGLDILSYDGSFLRTSKGESIIMSVWNSGRPVPQVLTRVGEAVYVGELAPGAKFTALNYRDNYLRYNPDGRLVFDALPAGKYLVRAWGRSVNVSNGRFDAYVFGPGSFGAGSEHQYMVGTPGNAKNAITVGAYDFRTTWKNVDGKTSFRNLAVGELSDYSNPGYSRDGTVKPDIVAPATYAISSLGRKQDSSYVDMGRDPSSITADGHHLAWSGTSAATPFVTGVVALMLQKNPQLDAEEIRKLLAKNATQDTNTGGTPNRDWGFGKLNPVATLKATKKG